MRASHVQASMTFPGMVLQLGKTWRTIGPAGINVKFHYQDRLICGYQAGARQSRASPDGIFEPANELT
jgi:hypothetical protein